METKYIFVTGGVTSSLGKGIISASLARLLLARGYRVTIQKFDPYINIDPGTLNPYEHGECYVTVDGHEADLDLGHYERFTNTPSQLAHEDFEQIFRTIKEVYGTEHAEEITLEANPDDLTEEYVSMLRTLPFNRISMGIQTFDAPTLKLLNRRHNAAQAIAAIHRLRQAGFRNISIDLIYGLPDETDQRWERDLQQAVGLDVEHISAYHLTYEKGTRIYEMLQSHRISEVDEESSVRFFSALMDTLGAAGYEHYEISNFCKPGMYSRHNTAYWKGIPYLGCGPSAHSFNAETREWNTASLEGYIKSIEEGHRSSETEILDKVTRYNEYIMTSLRTMWGISLTYTEEAFGTELCQYCTKMAAPYLQSHKLEMQADRLRLTREGIFVSDGIISDLMFID